MVEMIVDSLAIAIVAIGWIVSYAIGKRVEQRQSQQTYRETQLGELYGKIYGLLVENQRAFTVVLNAFDRKFVFKGDQGLPAEEKEIWLYYVENHFLPNNREIVDLIKNNIHLLHGYRFPRSFLMFIDYTIEWEALHGLYRKNGRDYPLHASGNFPREFQKDIIEIVSALKIKQLDAIQGDLSPSESLTEFIPE
jgi:hypothetical protein